MFQSDDQQLFIGKIPQEVQESDLRVCKLFLKISLILYDINVLLIILELVWKVW